jgi:hypothetical protein
MAPLVSLRGITLTHQKPPFARSSRMAQSIIDDGTARQLGRDLTEQHPATVFGMAKACVDLKPGFTITSCDVRAVRNDGCDVRVTTCRGDLCEMRNAVYEFHPPLPSADHWPNRITRIHNVVCSPSPLWLLTDPAAVVILIACTGLAYGTLYLGIDGMVEAIARAGGTFQLEAGINAIFGTTATFGYCVVGSFVFAVVAHGIEAAITVYHCVNTLKLEAGPTILWGLLVFSVGYPIFARFKEFTESSRSIDRAAKSH